MRRSIALVLFAVAGSALAVAQDSSKVDLFGGFSILNTDLVTGAGRENFFGWQASATGNIKPWFGIVADFGGQYKTYNVLIAGGSTPLSADVRAYEYLFGPQFRLRAKRASVFAHALAGGVHQYASVSYAPGTATATEDSFAMGFGAGMDVDVARHFAVRLVQFDWLPAYVRGTWQTDAIRLGFGGVVKLGH